MKRRKARKTGARVAKRVAKGSRGGAAPAPTMPRDVLRKLAKVLPSTVSTMHGEEYGADGARRLSANHKHPAAVWWVALLRLAREARGMKLREVAERTGLKRQALSFHFQSGHASVCAPCKMALLHSNAPPAVHAQRNARRSDAFHQPSAAKARCAALLR